MQSPTHTSLQNILTTLWPTELHTFTKLGEGVYGHCYGLTFSHPPYRTVIKLHKHPHIALLEHDQLTELSIHLPNLTPHVYAYLPNTELGDAILMSWLPGHPCPRPEQLPTPIRHTLQRQTTELLLHIHSIQHPAGFGSFTGPFYHTWWEYYSQRLHHTHHLITTNPTARTYLGPEILNLMDLTLQHGQRILNTTTIQPSLLHGDFCFNNLLFSPNPASPNPSTLHISGLLDPLDAEWGHLELDLVNIINGSIKHFELLNRYRAATYLGPHFPMRYWFYHIWKWLSYYTRVQTPCKPWLLRCAHELNKAMKKHL